VTQVQETARPRKRTGRRVLITLLVLLIVLAVALVVADRVAASYAERMIADRVSQEIASQQATAEQPEVTIDGVPFLTQVAGGEYQEIQILLTNLSGEVGKNQSVKMSKLDIRAQDVSAPLDTLRTGSGRITAGNVTGSGTVTYAELADLIGQEGLKLTQKDGKLIGTMPVKAAGQTFEVTGTANTEVTGEGVVRVRFTDITSDGLPDIPLVRNLVTGYVNKLAYDLKPPPLPLNLKVQKVEPRPEGLVVTAGASNVPLSAGGL
jgi:hypothetical protein